MLEILEQSHGQEDRFCLTIALGTLQTATRGARYTMQHQQQLAWLLPVKVGDVLNI